MAVPDPRKIGRAEAGTGPNQLGQRAGAAGEQECLIRHLNEVTRRGPLGRWNGSPRSEDRHLHTGFPFGGGLDIPYHNIITTDVIPGQWMVQIKVQQGSILEAACEAIVNAANSGQKGHTMRRVITGLVLVLFLVRPAEGGGAFQLTADVTRQIVRGIDHMANLNYAEAREVFRQLKDLPGGDLLSPLLEGLVDMDQAVQEERGEEEITEVLDRFLARM